MSASKIELRKIIHEGPHDEEYIYGTDHTLIFESGTNDDPATWRSGIVMAHIYPRRDGGLKNLQLNALWTFPPIEDPRESATTEAWLLGTEEIKLAAAGLITSIELRAAEEIESIHKRFKQAALKSEG